MMVMGADDARCDGGCGRTMTKDTDLLHIRTERGIPDGCDSFREVDRWGTARLIDSFIRPRTRVDRQK